MARPSSSFTECGSPGLVAVMRRSSPVGLALRCFFASSLGQRVFLKGVCATPPRRARARALFGAFADNAASRKDALRVTQSPEPSVTLDAVDALRAFSKPVLLAWGAADRLFPLDHARRLEADFADARMEVMNGASTFVMLDQPEDLAAKIAAFVSDTSSASPAPTCRSALRTRADRRSAFPTRSGEADDRSREDHQVPHRTLPITFGPARVATRSGIDVRASPASNLVASERGHGSSLWDVGCSELGDRLKGTWSLSGSHLLGASGSRS